MRKEIEEYLKSNPDVKIHDIKESAQTLFENRKREKIQEESKRVKKKEKEWWQGQNHRKNVGLYVDFDGKKWTSPENITKDTFLESLERVEYILDGVLSCRDIDESMYKSQK